MDALTYMHTLLIFLKAQWKQMFNQKPTFAANFTTVHGSILQVQTMMGDGHYSIKSFDPLNATVLELPYKGDRFSLFLIVPDSTQELSILEDNLSGQVSIATSLFEDVLPYSFSH